MTMLAPSGSFFALTEAGHTLFAASSNGGSILLEKSTDRGLSWSPSLVPLYAVSGGAPWDLAVVAADGSNLVLTAASGLSSPGGTGYYPGGPTGCNQNSTLLLASSHDGGLSWNSRAVYLPGEVITSLQAGIEGTQAAIAWIHQPVGACGAAQGEVSSVASTDAGASWTVWQNLTLGRASLMSDESLQMAPEGSGIVVAFLEQPTGAPAASLGLWLDAQGSGSGFSTSPMLLPAPSSWTLQGDPDTPALLVTPTYLIPIQGTSLGSLAAIPFFQLQQDGGGTGQLPRLISVVPLSSTEFEIAATLPQGDGVDCWQLGLVNDQVSQTCHVPLASLLVPSSEQFPIVALLDGGGYWIAVGAAGTPTCYDVCPVGAMASAGGTSGAAVGTSVCIEGCAAQQGLAAYAFNEGSSLSSALVSAFSGLIVVAGLAWMGAARRARRRLASSRPPTAEDASSGPSSSTEPYRVLGTYRRGMQIWVLAWVPLALMLLIPNSSGDFGIAPWLAVLGGILGGILVLPFHAQVRRTLQRVYGVSPGRLFQEDPQTDVLTQDHVRWAAFFAYLSWVTGFVLVILLLFSLSGVMDRSSASAYGGPGSTVQLGAGAFLLLVALLSVVLFRAIQHWQLSEAVLRVRAQMTTGSAETPVDPGLVLRTRVGTGLLVWNPFVGLLLGWAIQPVLPAAPDVLTLAFLPVTLLGILLLYGLFGKSTWTLEPVTIPSV